MRGRAILSASVQFNLKKSRDTESFNIINFIYEIEEMYISFLCSHPVTAGYTLGLFKKIKFYYIINTKTI